MSLKTRILVNGDDLELIDDVSMPLTFNIADIRDPEKRNGHYSKSVIIPGTAQNNKIFSHLWDLTVSVNSSGDTNYNLGFDPNLKVSAIVLFEGSQIFEGFLQLNRIVESHLGYKHDYEVTLFSTLIDLYANMGEKSLADLDLSKYNHTYNQSEQQNSWATSIKENGASVPFALGNGYVYPMIDYGFNNDTDYKVTHFFPAIYYKTIYDAILNENGFQYSSSFLTSTTWKSLIFPYTGGELKLTHAQIENRTHKASSTSDAYQYSSGSALYSGKIVFQNDSTGDNHDAGGLYNTATGTFIPTIAGTYKFNVGLIVSLTHYPSSSPATFSQNSFLLGYFFIFRLDTSSNEIAIGSVPVYAVTASNFSVANALNVVVGTSAVNSGDTTSAVSGILTTVANANPSDQFYVKWKDGNYTNSLYSGQTSPAATTRINIVSGSYFESQLNNTNIKEGDTVEASYILPSTVKQRDFITAVNKTFNLYYESDKNQLNKFFVEPRNDFYSSGTTQDWTYKLDESKDLEIIPMGELDARRYLWTWKPDSDHFNKMYSDKFGEIYGQRKYEIVNDFVKDERRNEVIFSPSPLAERSGSDRIITRIYQKDGNGVVTPKTANPRMLYYGGVKTTALPWNYIASSGTTVMTTYAYAGHLDSVTSPTIDINFGVPQEVYYAATTYTNNNIFNKYWKQLIDEITDKDSKIVTGYFHLSPVDIERLSFRDTYFFRGDNFRLNKIYDYNPIERRPTKCEFLKLKAGVPFTQTTKSINGGIETVFSATVPEIPPKYAERLSGNNSYGGDDSMIRGSENIVDPSAKGVIISGSKNYVGANCENITLTGSSGCTVAPNVKNVTVINSTGLTIDSSYSGKAVINGTIYGYKKILFKESSYTPVADDSGKFLIASPGAALTITLPVKADISEGWTIEVKHGNTSGFNVTVRVADAGVTLDDGTTLDTLTALQSFNYTYRSNVWYITT